MIIFMGVAGSGKSVQGRLLADKYGYPWISSGAFLRMLVSGDKRQQMLKGKLLDDSEIISLIQKIFSIVDIKNEFVFDGFPRTSKQVKWLLEEVKASNLYITAVIHLVIDKQVVKDRLLERGRQDDNDAAIEERFKEYEVTTMPIIDIFQKDGGVPVFEIDGDQTVEAVHSDIIRVLKG